MADKKRKAVLRRPSGEADNPDEPDGPDYGEYPDMWGIIAGHTPSTKLGKLRRVSPIIRTTVDQVAPDYRECLEKAMAFNDIENPSLDNFIDHIASMTRADFVWQHAAIHKIVEESAFKRRIAHAVDGAPNVRENYARILRAMFLSDAATVQITLYDSEPTTYNIIVGWGCRPDHDPTINDIKKLSPTMGNAKARLEFTFQIGNDNRPLRVQFSIFEEPEKGENALTVLDDKILKTWFRRQSQTNESKAAAVQAGKIGDAPLTACSVVGAQFAELNRARYEAVRYAYDNNVHRAADTLNSPTLYESVLRADPDQNRIFSLPELPDIRTVVENVIHLLVFAGSNIGIDPYLSFTFLDYFYTSPQPQQKLRDILTVCCTKKPIPMIGVFDAAC
jgi:hypothetical protein